MKPVFANGAKGSLCHGNMSILMALFLMDPIWWVRRRQAAPIWVQISWKSGMKLRYIRNNMKQLVSKGATNPSWRCPTERATDGHSGHGEWRFCFRHRSLKCLPESRVPPPTKNIVCQFVMMFPYWNGHLVQGSPTLEDTPARETPPQRGAWCDTSLGLLGPLGLQQVREHRGQSAGKLALNDHERPIVVL